MAYLTVSVATKSEKNSMCHSIVLDVFAILSMCLFDSTLCSQTNPAFSQKHIFVSERGWKCFGFRAKVPLWVHGSPADSAYHVRVVIPAEKTLAAATKVRGQKKIDKRYLAVLQPYSQRSLLSYSFALQTPGLLKTPSLPAPTQGFMTTHCHAPPKQFSNRILPGGAP